MGVGYYLVFISFGISISLECLSINVIVSGRQFRLMTFEAIDAIMELYSQAYTFLA